MYTMVYLTFVVFIFLYRFLFAVFAYGHSVVFLHLTCNCLDFFHFFSVTFLTGASEKKKPTATFTDLR